MTMIKTMRTVVTFPKRWCWPINTNVNRFSVNASSCVLHYVKILNACASSVACIQPVAMHVSAPPSTLQPTLLAINALKTVVVIQSRVAISKSPRACIQNTYI